MKYLLRFLFITLSLQVKAQQQFQWKETTKDGYTYKYVSNDPMNARFYTLKNGLTVILSPTPKDPRIQSYVAIKAGSKTDPSTNTGLAHYLEHMMFKGTDKYGSLDWAKEKPELDKINNLYEQYLSTKDTMQRRLIYRQIDSVSGRASKYSIANEYDKLMNAIGAQGTNAWTSFEQTVYTDDIPAGAVDRYLTIQQERFRNPVFRIFHTELEAVYEEKNRSLDDDGDKVFEFLFRELFKNHNYGKQTTIGTIEHLKNPSLFEIRKYYDTYYVPNNMAVVMSGDFDPDEVIKKVDAAFGNKASKSVPQYKFDAELPLTSPVVAEVFGPDAENLTMGYRLPGNKDKDAIIADLVGAVLTNGKAGLIDLNLVKKQKLLKASASTFLLIDHGILYLNGVATNGQSLEEVKSLMLGEIDKLKKGDFDENLLAAIVNNAKKDLIYRSESYSSRAYALVDAFTSDLDWQKQVAYVNDLSKVTKQDIVNFANKYLGDNYVAVFKRKGQEKNIVKIEKPAITPVETNADKQSDFVKRITAMEDKKSKPVFLNYDKDIQKSKIGNAEMLYVPNKDNSIFRLHYRYDVGSLTNKYLPLAAQYIQFIGTDKQTAEEISKQFYKIASNFRVNVSDNYTTVTIDGLQENFDKAVALYENLLSRAIPDEAALAALKERTRKGRADAKANKSAIMSGLTSYAMYGPQNRFNNVLSNLELDNVKAADLLKDIKNLGAFEQTIMYYGPATISTVAAKLKTLHKMPGTVPAKATPISLVQTDDYRGKVLFADYDMVQAETRWVLNSGNYDPSKETMINVFNNYFGGNMGSIVFQTIRESKALAYSTYGYYVVPQRKSDRFYMLGYVGSQADKFNDAVLAFNELLNTMPALPENLNLAKLQVKKDIETERITQDAIMFNYLAAKDKGLNYDIRKDVYKNVDAVSIRDVEAFSKANIAGKPFTYAIVASKSRLTESDLKKYGELKVLTLEEIFGY